MSRKSFLTAEWKMLVMANYEIDPAILHPYIPCGTELDVWQGKALVSMVGFLLLNTKVLGVPIPFHRNFEEVNLRFYVRHKAAEGWRRGVVFIKEIVPKWAIATVARVCYNENYEALPMNHRIAQDEVEYGWRCGNRWQQLSAKTRGAAEELVTGSEAEFITEHYWGYAKQRDGGTVEYRVEHPRWQVWQVRDVTFACDVKNIYGAQFVAALSAPPTSAFVAEGSSVTVYRGMQL